MNEVIIHRYVEPDFNNLTPNEAADCCNCMMAKKTRLLDGGEGYLCNASLYDVKTLSCFVPGVKPCSWIPVTDKLPEPFLDVLAYDSTSGSVELAFITRHFEWVGVCMNHEVTHWMPLPERPERSVIVDNKPEDI